MTSTRSVALGVFAVLAVACSSSTQTNSQPADSGVIVTTDAKSEVSPDVSVGDTPDTAKTPVPRTVDCSKTENCYHLACWDDPNCSSVADPGACKQGQVKDVVSGACRDCTAADCDGLPSFCCGTAACAGSVECDLYICKDIEASCAGTTSATCGFHDLDADDAWGDCDEAPGDPCCWCKIAVGCADSPCGYGSWVEHGACKPCSATTCDHISCMGLNGCPTNCPGGQYFDGVSCHDCNTSSSEELIPACKLPDGGVWTDPPDVGTDTAAD